MAILGLLTTESTGIPAERFNNPRRKVFYHYPNGAAPLLGILSMLKEEETDDPTFTWFEKRYQEQRTITATANAAGPFIDQANQATDDGATADKASPVQITAGTHYKIKVAALGTQQLRKGHTIKLGPFTMTSGSEEVIGVITDITDASVRVVFRAIKTTTSTVVNTGTGNNGKEVLVVGSSFAQGLTDISRAIYTIPGALSNFTQIFRAPILITGTALKTSVRYDETGTYKDQAKEASVNFMAEIEKTFIFGEKYSTTITDASGNILPQYFTGGILYFMRLWEAGTTYGNTAATVDTDDNKRIIANAAGTISFKTYSGYLERLFRVTNNVANEKLCLCGSGFLNVINQMYEGRAQLNSNLPMKDTFGMNVVAHETPFGKVYYKTHPLFNQNAVLRNNALFLDVQNLHYRYMIGRDMELLKGRAPNDADYKKDEWLGECGLELQYPESNLYLQNVTSFVP